MTEEADLQAKIAAISGKINERKYNPATVASANQYYPPTSYRGQPRWTPYGRGHPMHKNKTLVLANNTPSANQRPADANQPTPADEHLVGRGVHQLADQDTYGRQKRRRQSLQDNANTISGPKVDRQPARELQIEGIRFRLLPDGGKLIRVTDDDVPAEMAATMTPKKATISGVTFLRTRHGNLIRDNQKARSTHRTAKPQCEHFTKHGTVANPSHPVGYMTSSTRPNGQLLGKPLRHTLTARTGTCPFGPRCKFSHDPTKVAICKDYLRTGSCPNGEICDLSHEMSYHRVPACTYFLRGNCTNSACRYPHVHVSPAASVCRPFATLGFCAKGPRCDKRHVSECPDYANHGFCADRENGKCLLPHPDRASIMRKVAERQAKLASGDVSDVSSDEGQDAMDIDSDVAEVFTGSDEDNHELTQQQDFVAFS